MSRRRAKFSTSVASFSRMRRHPSDLFGGEVFGLDDPLLRLVSSLIHDFFRVSPNRERARGGKLPPSLLLLCPSSSARASRVFRSGGNFPDRIGPCEREEDTSTSSNVRYHYNVTTNCGGGKFIGFIKNALIDDMCMHGKNEFTAAAKD